MTEKIGNAAERPARILVVDDDDDVRDVIASGLRSHGHAVSEAASGRRGLDILDQGEAFDLVLVDYAMPGMNGLQFIDAARERWPGLSFMLLTGYADGDPLDAALGLSILRKPFRLADLADRVDDALGPMAEGKQGNVVPLTRSSRTRERDEGQ